MPRKPKGVGRNPGSVQAKPVEVEVRSHPVAGSARLETIGPEHPVWSVPNGVELDVGPADIVRIVPPVDAPVDLVRAVEARVREVAGAVKVVDARRSDVAPAPASALPAVARRSARDAVLARAREARVADPALLVRVCEDIMARVGLDAQAPSPAAERALHPGARETIAEIRLLNWKCFRGDTVLELEPKAYGVFARSEANPKESNALGKSSLLEAVDYAQTGRLPRECRRKSDWITRGEELGKVELVYSSGARISRSMGRSEAERLFFFPPGIDSEKGAAYQDAAQAKIDELLGLGKDDAGSWCFRQGEMAALLKMQDAKRVEMFSDWFRLGELEECQGVAAAARGSIEEQKAKAARERDAYAAGVANAYASAGTSEATFSSDCETASRESAKAEAEVKRLAEQDASASALWRERQMLAGDAARYDQLVEEGRRVAEELKALPAREEIARMKAGAESARDEAAREYEAKAADVRAVGQVMAGAFSGICPIAGEACPAAAFVVESVTTKTERLTCARREHELAGTALVRARTELGNVEGALVRGDRVAARLQELRTAARLLKPKKDRWLEIGDVPAPAGMAASADAEQAAHHANERVVQLQQAGAAARRAREKVAECEKQIRAYETAAEIPSAAALVFERVRREFAEGNLAVIEGYANEMLGIVGLDDRVSIRWGREGDGLADTCGACGQAFPASRKVKHCLRCGAERGPKVVEKLDIEPSRRSGAVDDFGGMVVALGSSRWIREERGSAWGMAMLDEATAQMDEAKRELFAARLPDVLRLAGFAQALVVSHHRETLESLPGRIEIVSSGGVSRATVVA